MVDFKKCVVDKIKETVDLSEDDIMESIEIPPESALGDYAFPTFRLAKVLRKAPVKIAEDLAKKMTCDENIRSIINNGPYVNFYIDEEQRAKTVFQDFKSGKFGQTDLGKEACCVIDFSSTNIAKPFHIGHLRSTVIGSSLSRILRYEGYKVVAVNHLGDYGRQFGMMIEAYKLWGNDEAINQNPIKELLKLYIRYNEEADKDPALLDRAREAFEKLEKGEPEHVRLWHWFKDISLKEFQRVYDLLDIHFDSYLGEAYHAQFVPDVLVEMRKKDLLTLSEGAWVVDLSSEDMIPAIIQKTNGSSTYITRDIATAIERAKQYHFEKNIYVVASEQTLHFKQLFKVLEKMGYDFSQNCIHVPFGLVSLKEGAMSTRGGNVIFLEDVLNRAIEKTRAIIEERNPEMENKDKVARAVGVGAVIFQDLFNSRIKDYVFDWDQVLNFEGETGPYCQYTCARAHSILNKSDQDITDPDVSMFKTQEEKDVVKQLYDFKEHLMRAAEKLEPSVMTRYTVKLSQLFNRFYANCPIHSTNGALKNARLALTKAVYDVLKIALYLIGLQAVDQM